MMSPAVVIGFDIPEPLGVAQLPSPRQKVELEADVPLPRLPTGRLPVTPADNGNPVPLVNTTADGVPSAGVTNVGDVASTSAPLPVSSVRAAARFALDGVARNVATPVPSPDTPELIGNPVAFVSVPLAGVPRAGVTSVGDVASTALPDPVLVVAPVPPFNTGSAVPESETARVPLVVTGEPATLRNVGTVSATDVTVPAPASLQSSHELPLSRYVLP